MFVSRKTYLVLQERYNLLQAKYSSTQEQKDAEIYLQNEAIAELERHIDAYRSLIKECVQWMNEIALPKKTAGTADKERRREKLCQEAKALGIVEQETPDAT